MSQDQLGFVFSAPHPLPPDPIPDLSAEIAQVWGLPVGQEVNVTFRAHFPVPAAAGRLALRSAPAYPWDVRQPLALRVAGCDFTSHDMAGWALR